MEKLLFKKGRKSPGRSFLNNFIPLFAPFRYAPLLKEGNENCKQYLGLKLKCKFETGLTSEKCKLFLGRVNLPSLRFKAHLQSPQAYTQTKACKRAFQPIPQKKNIKKPRLNKNL